LSPEQKKLYDLVWKRMVASQMESAQIDQVAVDISAQDGKTILRANGSTVAFDGFLRVYEEGKDDAPDEEDKNLLPIMNAGEAVTKKSITPSGHFTQPPPRYTEASLVKKMEELGIGRPSTYASTLQVLQTRKYVRLDKKVFFPEDRGRVVTAFLCNYFGKYVEYSFTANLEDELDKISDGELPWKTVIQNFWGAFKGSIDETQTLTITQVLETLERDLQDCFFPALQDGSDPQKCPSCETGKLGLRLGKFGAFIGCTAYPTCAYTRKIGIDETSVEDTPMETDYPKVLGNHPETKLEISLKKGPYGIYAEMAPSDPENKKSKPKRASLPKALDPTTVTLDTAVALLALPRTVGNHPETGEEITASIGPFGPYVKHGKIFASLKKHDDPLTVTVERAVELIKEKEAAPPKAARKKKE
jgi:DNA topoisomerase-1